MLEKQSPLFTAKESNLKEGFAVNCTKCWNQS